jgi:hypothetical protein
MESLGDGAFVTRVHVNFRNIPPGVTLSLPVTTQVLTTASGLAYSRVTQTFDGTLTIKNIGTTIISGPLQIVLTSLTTGVTLTNATGTFNGMPYLAVPAVPSLGPGQSATVGAQFKNPSNAVINFTAVVYSGSLGP